MKTPTGEYDPQQVQGDALSGTAAYSLLFCRGSEQVPQLYAGAECVVVSRSQWPWQTSFPGAACCSCRRSGRIGYARPAKCPQLQRKLRGEASRPETRQWHTHCSAVRQIAPHHMTAQHLCNTVQPFSDLFTSVRPGTGAGCWVVAGVNSAVSNQLARASHGDARLTPWLSIWCVAGRTS